MITEAIAMIDIKKKVFSINSFFSNPICKCGGLTTLYI